jgi:hypothetical protein
MRNAKLAMRNRTVKNDLIFILFLYNKEGYQYPAISLKANCLTTYLITVLIAPFKAPSETGSENVIGGPDRGYSGIQSNSDLLPEKSTFLARVFPIDSLGWRGARKEESIAIHRCAKSVHT